MTRSKSAACKAVGTRRLSSTYRQDVHYLHTTWDNTYRPIRSHNEGANGRFKSDKIDIGNPEHRPAPGQVTQTLLLAVMFTVANLTVLETWLTERDGPGELTDADFEATGPLPPTPLRPSRRRQPSVDGIRRRVKNDDSLDRYQRRAYDTDDSTQCGLGHSIDRDR
ncbi:hypothetical protein [Streptomyces sp. NPDC058665]|uniref:hypothetical protein n=1 Tax=Streptomyces sp. NPDC058665 TaxID=3346586 RepID=UPI0036591C86